MREIRKRLDKDADHAEFLAGFVGRHKAKPNLMKLLQAKWHSLISAVYAASVVSMAWIWPRKSTVASDVTIRSRFS